MFLMYVSQIIPFYNYSQVPENIVHTPDTLFSPDDQNKVYNRTSHTLTILATIILKFFCLSFLL
ncbi:hypothetical protein NITHO_6690001 [Nitrolancea hollandica Lb]|uniref:Uncharacterized protein n=1 Tax=Nitrolancea hollandica Lb TaxID=1129897 RepID=I4EMW6_9BACT|nr:hypothetical protein NITHO_6690001 [Nitrolancea hollandica Lb]